MCTYVCARTYGVAPRYVFTGFQQSRTSPTEQTALGSDGADSGDVDDSGREMAGGGGEVKTGYSTSSSRAKTHSGSAERPGEAELIVALSPRA